MPRTRSLAGITIASIAVIVVTACSSSSSNGSLRADPGATLSVGMAIATSSMNPAKGPVAAYQYYAYDPVIYETPDGRSVPDLATTWSYVGTGNTAFEFTLRKGMTFADGTPVTATAVKNSLDYFLKANGPNISYAGPVKSISVVSEDTVRITYSAPYPDAVDSLTQDRSFGLIIGPAGLADPASLETSSDGVGHYKLDASLTTPGNVYTFVPDPHYFNQDAIKYAKVQLKPMTDPAAQLAALQSGQIQFAQRMPSTNVASAKSAGKKIVQGIGGLSVLVLEDRDGVPLNNQKVRQALQHAVDRGSLVKAIYGGYATPQYQLATQGTAGYLASENARYAYDPSLARQLLREAGYPNGLTISLIEASLIDPNGTLAQAISSELAAVGVKVNLTLVAGTYPQYAADIFTKKYQSTLTPLTLGGLYFVATQVLDKTQTNNVFGSSDEQVNRLLADIAAAVSGSAQQTGYLEQLNRRLNELAWLVPIAVTYSMQAVDAAVRNVPDSFTTLDVDPVGPETGQNWYSTR